MSSLASKIQTRGFKSTFVTSDKIYLFAIPVQALEEPLGGGGAEFSLIWFQLRKSYLWRMLIDHQQSLPFSGAFSNNFLESSYLEP